MNLVYSLLILLALFITGLLIYHFLLRDILNFVIETNDDVEDFKKRIKEENGS